MRTMRALLKLVAYLAAGVFIGKVFHLEHLEVQSWYEPLTAALLAIGLYASTYGIQVDEARRHVKLIITAVTIGVLVKALIIGGTMWLIWLAPVFFVRAIGVSQIDPLSVARLMRKDSPMSEKAKSLLGAWSAFDDPMTVLLGLYVPSLIVQGVPGSEPIAEGGASGYIIGLGLNLVFAGFVWVVWRYLRVSLANTIMVLVAGYGLLTMSFATAVMFLMMLGLALIGLFLRPSKAIVGEDEVDRFDTVIERAVDGAYMVAAVLLGVLLVHGINIWVGLAMGVVAYFVQALVALPLTRKLGWSDRVYLMFASQLGITAIILALRFEPAYPGTVAVVAPTIIVTNLLFAVMNKWAVPRLIAKLAG
jgi:NhaP-type Na+/H+ or K+/H+ antiporter